MNLNIGKKIRELRKRKNISQEVLAQFLGVSFQAVSKWENDDALPDVTLIPAIASFFDVSTDELFDYNRLEMEQKVYKICREAYEYRESDPEKSERILREGLRQFPGNDIILNNLLYTMRSPERSDEVVSICKTLIESTAEDDVKYDALRILAETYHDRGEQALVKPTLEKIPEIYFTKVELMARLLDGEESLDRAIQQMGISLCQTIDMLLIMRDRLNERNQTADAEKYERIAGEIVALFRHEEGERFETEGVYCWTRKMLSRFS